MPSEPARSAASEERNASASARNAGRVIRLGSSALGLGFRNIDEFRVQKVSREAEARKQLLSTRQRRIILSVLAVTLTVPALLVFVAAWWIGDTMAGLTLERRFQVVLGLLASAVLGLIGAIIGGFALVLERRRGLALGGIIAGVAPTITAVAMLAYLGQGPFAR